MKPKSPENKSCLQGWTEVIYGVKKEEVRVKGKENICRTEPTHKHHLLCLLFYQMGIGGEKETKNC